jgi:hypothetical protein
MAELAPERAVVKQVLASAGYAPWLYEVDAGAGPGSPRQTYLDALYNSDVYLGIFGESRGAFTIDEFDAARRSGIACLIYEKHPAEREPDLSAFLEQIGDVERGVTIRRYGSPEQLAELVTGDVRRIQAELIRVWSSDGRTYTRSPHGGRFDLTAKATPIRRHPLQASNGPRPPEPFIDRIIPVDRLRQAISSGEPMLGLAGVPGSGKTSTLRRVAHDPNVSTERFPDGLGIYIEGGQWPRVGDLLRRLWSELYRVGDHQFVPDEGALRADLRAKTALVFIDGVRLSPEEVERLHAEVPRSTFVVAADETAEGAPDSLAYTKAVRLADFDQPADIVALFEAGYGEQVSPQLAEVVVALCRRTGTSPGMITKLAHEAWGSGLSMSDWVRQRETGSEDPAAGVNVDDLRVLRILAAFGPDIATPGEVTSRLGVRPEQMATLIDSGRVYAASPDHRLAGAEYLNLISGSDLEEVRGQVFEATVQWIEEATAARVQETRAFILRVLEWGAERERHRGVLLLAMSLAPHLAVSGAWDSWGVVNDQALIAAQAVGSTTGEGWALHEAGTRHLMLGNRREARRSLRAARRLRRRHDDVAGAAISTHNLSHAGGIATTWKRWAVVAGAVLVIGAAAQMIQAVPVLDFGEVVTGNVSVRYQEFANDGDAAITHSIEIAGDPAFCVLSPEGPICPSPAPSLVGAETLSDASGLPKCTFDTVAPGEATVRVRVDPQSECAVGVRFAPILDPGDTRREARGELLITTDDERQTVRLIGVGIVPGSVTTTTTTTLATTTTIRTSTTTSGPEDPTSTVTVTTTTIPANLPPVAVNDESEVEQSGQVRIAVLENDVDPELDPTRILDAANPSHGTVEVIDDLVLYTHDGSSAEPDSFEYRVTDDIGGVATATVSIQVIPNGPPTAVPVDIQVFCGDTSTITLSGSDPDGDPLQFTITDAPDAGTLGPIQPTSATEATVDYTAGVSDDVFAFQVDDGLNADSATVTVSVPCVE